MNKIQLPQQKHSLSLGKRQRENSIDSNCSYAKFTADDLNIAVNNTKSDSQVDNDLSCP